MDRRACADVPALALQLLLAAHPEWKTLPVAVVDADEPNGIIQWVNAAAWRVRLRPGMRYASALALEGRLRAGTVASSAITATVADITTLLQSHTPYVEASNEEPGVFWLDANGLESLYTSVHAWAQAIVRSVRTHGFEIRFVVGFTRFGTYALGKMLGGDGRAQGNARGEGGARDRNNAGSTGDAYASGSAGAGKAANARNARGAGSTRSSANGPRRVQICESEEEERRLMREVLLERLGIEPKLRDALARLAVRTVGEFLRLPAEGIRRRFGEQASHLHRRARGETWDPLVPLPPAPSLKRSLLLDDPVFDTGIVLFVVRRLLAELVSPLAAREQGAAAVTVTLHRSLRRDMPPVMLGVRAAEPTLDEAVLADLVQLRLETEMRRELSGSSIVEIDVEIETAAAGREQLRLFHERTRRDLTAGSRALARLRAELGEQSVVRAVLRQGHLPEATYAWEPIDRIVAPSPRLVLLKPLVRRMYEHAIALPPKPFRERDDCWIPSVMNDEDAVKRNSQASASSTTARRRGATNDARRIQTRTEHGRVDHMTGPYIVSGGWWNREVHREYHFARTDSGEILWVYYDRRRRRWYLTGKVE